MITINSKTSFEELKKMKGERNEIHLHLEEGEPDLNNLAIFCHLVTRKENHSLQVLKCRNSRNEALRVLKELGHEQKNILFNSSTTNNAI